MPNCLGKLLREAEAQDAEMLLFDYATVTNGKSQQVVYPKIADRLLPGDELLRQVQEQWYVCVPTAWNKLYKREFLMQNGFLFTENVMYEDTDISLKMLAYLKRIKYTNVVAYNYRNNERKGDAYPEYQSVVTSKGLNNIEERHTCIVGCVKREELRKFYGIDSL